MADADECQPRELEVVGCKLQRPAAGLRYPPFISEIRGDLGVLRFQETSYRGMPSLCIGVRGMHQAERMDQPGAVVA